MVVDGPSFVSTTKIEFDNGLWFLYQADMQFCLSGGVKKGMVRHKLGYPVYFKGNLVLWVLSLPFRNFCYTLVV